ncbi:MAG TPA: cbb3-type cytochrome c oxidase N-terminal domain-containing protein, partial [Cytophagales bacterium]|nr:cbb3-type cytochrome c oxidase N-terminal domain-containing protein [Cytophagales bacterium]
VERDEEIQLSHNYDGIVELDNTMPPWLRAIFGVTIVFAISYLGYYYVLGLGKFQIQEYTEEMEKANIEIAEYQKKAANSINEENVVLEKDQMTLAAAKELFSKNCKTCHGANAEGGAGPNLTDAYWLHGGTIKEVFKTIKYGVPAKGMIAWQQKLTPKDIQSLTGYIMSLQGSNPPGAKAPQGLRSEEPGAVPLPAPQELAPKGDSINVHP